MGGQWPAEHMVCLGEKGGCFSPESALGRGAQQTNSFQIWSVVYSDTEAWMFWSKLCTSEASVMEE